jgi:hypothetical protein
MRLGIALALVLVASVAFAGLEPSSPSSVAGSGSEFAPRTDYVLKWLQLPLVGGNAYASQLDVCYPFYAECSDDFLCSDPSPITAIDWWGLYWNPGAPPFADHFVIRFYTNNPGPPSTPANLLYEEECTVYTEEWDSYYGQYHYFQELTVPFPQEPGHIYWISIQSVFCYPPQWGWCGAAEQWQDFAVQDFALVGIPRWTPLDVDLAFSLYTTVPTGVDESSWGSIKALFR